MNASALAWALGALTGAAAYFAWPTDIAWAFGLWPVGIGLILAGIRNHVWGRLGWFLVAVGCVFMIAGHQVEEKAPERGGLNWAVAARKPHWVVGRIVEIRNQEPGTRNQEVGTGQEGEEKPKARGGGRVTLVLDEVTFYQLPGAEGIKEVRVGVYRNQAQQAKLKVGDGVAVPVLLVAPEGPRFNGDRDNRVWPYMQPESVRAYARGSPEKTVLPDRAPPASPDAPASSPFSNEGFQGWVDGARSRIDQETSAVAGGVVSALLTGNQAGLEPRIREAYRVTGLTHLIAISGMQLTLVAGGIFFMIRWLAAWWPTLILRVNIKAYAAFAGLLGAAGYTFLAGAGVSVVRAFVMVALLMLAVMTGRVRSALRAWCVAVVIILMVSPVMILSAGFQLSVAAVLALLLWATLEPPPQGFSGWVRGLIISSIVAGVATAPLVVFTFGQLSAVGLPANIVAVPLMAVATYLGMFALLLWPLGLQAPLVAAMGWVVAWVNRWALWLSDWQGSVAIGSEWTGVVAAFSAVVLTAVFLRRWGLAAFGMLAMALLAWGVPQWRAPPDVLLMDGGRVALERNGNGKDYRVLWASDPREARFLLKRAGFGHLPLEPQPSRVANTEIYQPKGMETIAWAEKRGHKWFVKHKTCGRVWQRVDNECYGLHPEGGD